MRVPLCGTFEDAIAKFCICVSRTKNRKAPRMYHKAVRSFSWILTFEMEEQSTLAIESRTWSNRGFRSVDFSQVG